jgi:hypothetical protein
MPAEHPYSVATARRAAEQDQLAQWVADFLASPGSDNAVLGAQLGDAGRLWLGPVQLPIERLHRFAGPPGHPVLRTAGPDEWRDDVAELAEKIDDPAALPPVVVSYRSGVLLVEDGNHRLEALREADVDEAWAVVGFASEEDRQAFQDQPAG